MINTVQHPLPSPKRCYNLGRSLGRAIEAYPEDLKVVIIGTGGLSHQLDGERAEFINWLAMRGALNGNVKSLHTNYNILISNTAAGLMCLENAA